MIVTLAVVEGVITTEVPGRDVFATFEVTAKTGVSFSSLVGVINA